MKNIVLGLVMCGITMLALTLAGTLLWLAWPIAIPAALPGLVSAGFIAAKLTWWQSACLTWVFGILFKSTLNQQKKA